jgi:2-keto-4-pentenoate hydratase/2-oxohepta-3-ene-1,7-dioic acid hydratase in catechol pathway
MKIANIEVGGKQRVAVITEDGVIDLSEQLGAALDDAPRLWTLGTPVDELARNCIKRALPRIPLAAVKFLPPLLRPDKVLGVGMNYHSFVAAAREIGFQIPANRVWFLRPRGCITGPDADVWLPRGSTDFDYEVELTVVIGRRCRRVSIEEASAVIAGYTVANDMTLRSQVPRSLVFAKSCDTHTPIGPWIVTPDEVGDVQSLAVKTWVNGELRQNGSTADMIASCHELVAEVSAICTLNPGDIIMTGTPDGCGIFHRPPRGLAAGDVVKLEIEGIGTIENRIVNEPEDCSIRLENSCARTR